MLLQRNKRKSRDFVSGEPEDKKKFTLSDLIEAPKWNPGLYTLKRFDVPLPINKRCRELSDETEESKMNELDEFTENLVRPLKRLHITPKKVNSQSPPACIKQSTIRKSPQPASPAVPGGDTNLEKFKNSGNPKKVSLMEFLYNDNEDDFPKRPSAEKDGKKKPIKVSDGMGSWIGEIYCQDLSQNPKEPSTALTLYEHPFNILQRRWIQYLHKYTTPEWGETRPDPFPSQIKVEEVDDDEEDQLEDLKGNPWSHGYYTKEGRKFDRGFFEGYGEGQQGEEGDSPDFGFDKYDSVEEVDHIYPWYCKDNCQDDGSWFQKNIPHSTLNGNFEVAQKGA